MTGGLYSDPDLVQFYDIENTGGNDALLRWIRRQCPLGS